MHLGHPVYAHVALGFLISMCLLALHSKVGPIGDAKGTATVASPRSFNRRVPNQLLYLLSV